MNQPLTSCKVQLYPSKQSRFHRKYSSSSQCALVLKSSLIMERDTEYECRHPIEWRQASASTAFPVPITDTKDLPIGKLMKDLHPKWLSGGVNLKKAIQLASQDSELESHMQRAKKRLHLSQTKEVWYSLTAEEDASDFCKTWLEDLNEPRQLQRYRYRFV